jgi:ABC-type multidrug transport system permease subunit
MLFKLTELIVLATFVGVAGDFNYYTWWALTLYIISNLAAAIEIEQFWLTDASAVASISIAIVVPLCSLTGCTLFEWAFASSGGILYIAGNVVLHYYPALQSLNVLNQPQRRAASYGGTRFFLLYVILHDAAEMYGCPTSHRVMVAGGVLITMMVDAVMDAIKTK